MDIRYSHHHEDAKHYDTETLRRHFLIEDVFVADTITMTYSHYDRIIASGIMPVKTVLKLEASQELASDYFLQRREMGVINIGGKGYITLDGEKYELNNQDAIYVGRGVKSISFECADSTNPPKFYMNSCPAHTTYPTKKISLEDAKKVHTGSDSECNKRTINQYVHPAVCESCQLAMGMTMLAEGSIWNTMPCHTHERRMEVYLYFNIDSENVVFHLMGQAQETRHIVIKNEQAVISPSWSIHSGVGTKNYTFIWGMCGENQEFTDMDAIKTQDLK